MREGDLSGRTLADRYDVLELLGAGGMGAVYRAHDRELDELVALKVVRGDRATPAVLEQFRREVKLARRVTHVNVARTFELVNDGDLTFCTMELIEGESLRHRLERERTLVAAEAVGVTLAVCDALVAAHAAGVIHRDIKPDNILVAHDDRVVVADFGVAAVTLTGEDGLLSGTLEYMAPEQARGEAPTPASDVYAVGLVLYEMLTGLRAFAGTMSELIVAKQDVERVSFELANTLAPGAVPAELADVVGRATARDPADRIATAADLARALTPWSEARPRRTVTRTLETRRTIRTVIVLAPRALTDAHVHLAEGVHEALLRELVAVPHIRVWPRVVAGEVPPDAVVVEMRVRDYLEVDLRKGDAVARLVVPLAVEHVSIAAQVIAHATVDQLDRAAQPVVYAATELLLRARRLVHAQGFLGAGEAIELLERAHAMCPDDARIAATLAMLNARFLFGRQSGVDMRPTQRLVATALLTAPELVETHVAAGILEQQTGDPALAAAHFRRAIACSPYIAEGHEALGRMLLEAGFLDDALGRLDDALAIAPDLSNVRWEIARAYALEQDWTAYDRLIAELRAANDNPFTRLRMAWWRGNFTEVHDIRTRHGIAAGRGFEPELIDRLYRIILDRDWPSHRDAICARVLADRSQSRRRISFLAQLACDCAGYAGDVPTCLAMLAHAVANGLYDMHWLEKCPFLAEARATPRGKQLVEQVGARAITILDALYCDRDIAADTIHTAG